MHIHTQLCLICQSSEGVTSVRAAAERFICLLTLVLTVNLKLTFCLAQNSDVYLIVVGDCADSVRSWWEVRAHLGCQHRFTCYSKGSLSAPAPVAAIRTVPAVGTSPPNRFFESLWSFLNTFWVTSLCPLPIYKARSYRARSPSVLEPLLDLQHPSLRAPLSAEMSAVATDLGIYICLLRISQQLKERKEARRQSYWQRLETLILQWEDISCLKASETSSDLTKQSKLLVIDPRRMEDSVKNFKIV